MSDRLRDLCLSRPLLDALRHSDPVALADGPDAPLWEQGWRAVPQGDGASPHARTSSGEVVTFSAGPDPYSQLIAQIVRNSTHQMFGAHTEPKPPRTYRLSCSAHFGASASRAADASWALRVRPLPSNASWGRSRPVASDTDASACVAGYLWDVPTSFFEATSLTVTSPAEATFEATLEAMKDAGMAVGR